MKDFLNNRTWVVSSFPLPGNGFDYIASFIQPEKVDFCFKDFEKILISGFPVFAGLVAFKKFLEYAL